MPDDRLAQLQRLREADPADADVPYMIAQEHAKHARTAEALEAYDQCLALNPAYLYAYFHKARALEADDRIPEAIETIRRGI
ncbi:MAG: hypothetical protein ACTS3F_01005 [Phycisphaerales bacterium]